MKNWQKHARLMRFMIVEEYRLNAAMIGKFQFLFFPLVITLFCLVLSVSSKELLTELSIRQIYLILHAFIALYGLGVGGFALFGERMAEQRIGQVNLLLETPKLHPVEFRYMFLLFYIKDVLFYLFLSIGPIILGIGVSIPMTGFRIAAVLFLCLTLSLSFLLGISFSFFLSSVYVRRRRVFVMVVVALLLAILGSFLTGRYDGEHILPTLMFQYTADPSYLGLSLLLILAFSTFAIRFIKVELGKRSQHYPHELLGAEERFGFMKGYSTFLAKEWLDLKRSRTLYPVIFAYIGPLVILTTMVWFLTEVAGVSLKFNMVFYGSMIGFFGITIYSWLNIVDTPNFYDVLPVPVPVLIRTKMAMFALLGFSISTVFLVVLGIINDEVHLLWLALPVALITTPYTVTITAYLTGLRTNSYLFDPRILGKFMVMVALPLIVIMFASFSLEEHFAVAGLAIGVVCVLLALLMMVFYKGIGRRWGRESFVF